MLLLALLVVVSSSGCARVRAALAVQTDDTVVGEVVVATPEKGPTDRGPPITVPPGMEKAVDVSEYRQDGYVGSVVRFSRLRFEQLPGLLAAAGPPGAKVAFGLRRAGNRVLASGLVDLTTVPVDRADFQLKISFPGEVLEANGVADAGTVSWVFKAGTVGDINAVAVFRDPTAPSPLPWTLTLGGGVALAAAWVVLLARRTRNAPVGIRGQR